MFACVVKQSANMSNRFRWVECQFVSLASCPSSQHHLENALNSLPRSLDETYNRMLMNIDPELAEDAKRILTLLCFAKRPVTVQEIIEGLAVELGENPRLNDKRRLGDPNDVIRICPGLISISTSEDEASLRSSKALQAPKVRITHFSVQEYLKSDRIQSPTAAKFALHSYTANTELANICLIYLQNAKPTNLDGFPLASYAAKHWHEHLPKGDEKCDSLDTLIIDLFRSENDVFQNWIRICDPDDGWPRQDLTKSSKDIASPLYYASLLGLYQILRELLQIDSMKKITNAIKGFHGTALQAAVFKGHSQIVQLLLDEGADINTQGGTYGNALQAASLRGHEQVVQLFLDKGADVNAQGGYHGNALQAASRGGHEKVVQLLLDKDADVNAQGGYHGNALQAASRGGHEKVVQLLLDKGADINA
jgi:ankyrin repeat domain-containing protein 50